MTDSSDMTEREDRIRRRAHELWEEAGQPSGEDERFWREAEQEIDQGPIRQDDPAGSPIGKPRR